MEIELKFPLRNTERVRATLDRIAKSGPRDVFQRDTYYNHPSKDFLRERPVREWLRVRETPRGATLNYKSWHTEVKDVTSCDEIEARIEDPGAIKELLERLGFCELVVVEKKRSVWRYKDVEVALDDVEGLGTFIEFEEKGDATDVVAATRHLHGVLSELGADVGERNFKGYPYLLLEKRGHRL
jgi:adenylate cyclase class 2